MSASAYYQRASGQRSARRIDDERLLGVITELHAANYYAYGSRRMWKALIRAGEQVGRSRVERLMRQNGLQGAKRRGKPWRTTKSDPRAHRPPDLVKREFAAQRPDEKWFADFTYLRCWEGLVFFSFVIDAFSRRIVGWQFASHMRTDLVLDALRAWRSISASPALMSAWSITATPEVTSWAFSERVKAAGPALSMGRVGDAFDNAMMEASWGRMQTELLNRGRWRTRLELANAIFEYLEIFHNRKRRHSALGMLTPTEYETLYHHQQAA